jgi:hypothetical protein
LTLALEPSDGSVSRPTRIAPGESASGTTHWIGGCVCPRAVWTLWSIEPGLCRTYPLLYRLSYAGSLITHIDNFTYKYMCMRTASVA